MAMIDPENYENNNSVAARDGAELVPKLAELMGEWTPNENILDYGCGTGSTGFQFILPRVLESDSILYSVDVSANMVNFAKENYPHERIIYAQGNILEEFPFKDVQFDKIFSILVCSIFQDMSLPLQNFLDIMKPGGRLGFTVMSKSAYYAMMTEFGGVKWKKYMRDYKEYFLLWVGPDDRSCHQACQKLLHEVGFNIIHLEILKRSYHQSIETMLEFCISLNPLWTALPADLLPELKEDLRTFITSYAGIPRDSPELTLDYESIFAVVEKP